MPIHAVQMDITPGQPEKNLKRALQLVERAGNEDPEGLVVFPEMTIPGYFIGDEWKRPDFVNDCHEMSHELVAKTRGGLGIIFGNVTPDFTKVGEDGTFRRYNSAIVAHDGEMLTHGGSQYLGAGLTHKSLMPNYGMFHDKRYFTSLRNLAKELGVGLPDVLKAFDMPINGTNTRVGVITCEDMWDHDYLEKPVDILREDGAEVMINLSSSPFGIGKAPVRDAYLRRQSKGFKQFWYVNNVGRGGNGKNEHVFDGSSLMFADGVKKMQAPTFQEGTFDAESGVIPESPHKMKEVFDALIFALRERWESLGKKKVVIGLSGGIDSAVSAALLKHAIGAENIVGVNMPSEYNGETLKGAAQDLANKLGIAYHIIPLADCVNDLKSQVETVLAASEGGLDGLAHENMQARHRSSGILSAVASHADIRGMYTNNGNKSEIFTGYCTLYGDVNGFMAPLGDLYKTQIRSLARYINATYGEIIPNTTLEVAASAELSAEQSIDSKRTNESPFRGEGGDPFVYPYHDALFYHVWDLNQSPAQILRDYADGKLAEKLHKNYDFLVDPSVTPVHELEQAHRKIDALMQADPALFIEDFERIYQLLRNNFFKRIQSPTIVALSRRPFGYDTHEAENGIYWGREYEKLKQGILRQKQ